MPELAQVNLIDQFEGLFVHYVFPIYHYIRQDKWMTYFLYTYLSLLLIHFLTKYIRGKLTKKSPPFEFKTLNGDYDNQPQNLGQLKQEIKEIKSFLKDLTQASTDGELIQQIQKQSGSIAMIQQNFQKFTKMQEEFQRCNIYEQLQALLQTQSKMMSHMNKTLSQHSNNNQSASLSFNPKQDSPRSQNDSNNYRILQPDQSILSQGNHQRTISDKNRADIINQEVFLQQAQGMQTTRRKQSGEDGRDTFTPQTTSRELNYIPQANTAKDNRVIVTNPPKKRVVNNAFLK